MIGDGWYSSCSLATPSDSVGVDCTAIHCAASGNLVAVFLHDTAAVTLPVTAGSRYEYALRYLKVGTTATVYLLH
jgi:Mn-containing catalase